MANGKSWNDAAEIQNVERVWLRPGLGEMYDITWSPCSNYIMACSIDQRVSIHYQILYEIQPILTNMVYLSLMSNRRR